MKRRPVLVALLSMLAMSVAAAQYLNRRDPKTPRLPDGGEPGARLDGRFSTLDRKFASKMLYTHRF